ncbi:MAG TPA: HAD-IA family hydrolase [Anaeromyxobacter sp.]|nr:HAD-IA family hydrolase [Anaeromyxobacter sp.]
MPSPLCVLFDMDGTLVDTVPFILACVHHTFEGYGGGPTDSDWVAGIGTPLQDQLASFARRVEDVAALLERYRAFWRAHHDRLTHCFPGALETVAALSGAGHPLGIVTAKTESSARRTLAHTGLLVHMGTVVGADSCPRCKPFPDPVLLAMDRLGAAPDRTVLVGDSVHDVAAAVAAGVRALAAAWGAAPVEALRAAGAARVLSDIRDLPGVVAVEEAAGAGRS